MINMLISVLVWINRKKPYRRTRTFVLPLERYHRNAPRVVTPAIFAAPHASRS